jgi:hypothetical protein
MEFLNEDAYTALECGFARGTRVRLVATVVPIDAEFAEMNGEGAEPDSSVELREWTARSSPATTPKTLWGWQ